MKTLILRSLLMVALLGVLGTVTACKHTANGAGKDIEQMGEKIQEKTQ